MSENESEKVVSVSVFKALAQLSEQVKKRVQSANGELGERIRAAVDNGGLHAGAFKSVMKLHRLDVMKRNDFLRSFNLYLEYAEQHLWAGETADMFDGDDAEEESPEEQKARDAAEFEAAGKANAKKLEKGIAQLAPEDDKGGKKPRSSKVVGFPGAEGKALN